MMKEDEKNGMYERIAWEILRKHTHNVALLDHLTKWHWSFVLKAMEEYRSLSKVEQVEQDLSEKETSFYKLIAPLVTTYQMSPEDWNLGPMSKRNWKAISRQIDTHNDRLKELAIQLKNKFEALTRRSSTVEKPRS